ncbi:hypothetical protein EJ05DRAFT_493437 [Pseudovirgaria hyperparasitica]|uniref:DUF8004 domain-containing protein n=1 Tax=Pseudovirgaria hyperparasitica TaxID=470096 RepID=A0A6A6W2U4_9PEZI|nr:uncharacterized protein EJ05DRAFT_493437 [Pseudovirgaria hyperparasitica]KAF2756913.1 hypothetical protein EJ05DRAFT_493437 [Pseudovirgaria hyperparasitica]
MEAFTRRSKRLSTFLSFSSNDDLLTPAAPAQANNSSTSRIREKSPLPSHHPVQPPSQNQPALPPLETELLPPPRFSDGAPQTGSPASSRPGSIVGGFAPTHTLRSTSDLSEGKPKKKFLSKDLKDNRKISNKPSAWIAGHDEVVPYTLGALLAGQRVSELWDYTGDTFIYLFPRTSDKGPSFRVHSAHYSSSPVLTRIAHGRVYSEAIAPEQRHSSVVRRKPIDAGSRHSSLSDATPPPDTSPDLRPLDMQSSSSGSGSGSGSRRSRPLTDPDFSGPAETHLYLPLTLSPDVMANKPNACLTVDDSELLIGVRNLFAFLVGQSLVATERRPSVFSAFMKIAELLDTWEFSNLDGSTHGEVASASFANYVEELNLDDVRSSREKTVEAIVLGERMRCQALYNEGFVHGVGKRDELKKMKSPKFTLISSKTHNKMDRAAMDLEMRQKNINGRLQDFDFPSIFAGIMNSKTSSERKQVRFQAWQSAFMGTRKYIMGYYKHKYGAWPPKASSKKNSLETSGLNRLVLKELYDDMSVLYDMLVDRTNLTTRTLDPVGQPDDESDEQAIARALRLVLSEYDRASPPVQPPIPFDVPLLPSLSTIRKDHTTGDAKRDAKTRAKKLKDDEVRTLLKSTHNADAVKPSHPFLAAFFELESKTAHNRTFDEILDLRIGQWLFLYAVLNALPMLVIDAPGLKWTAGVEYFLCEVPRSGVPWARTDDAHATQRNWYGIAGSTGVVSLPADVVEHGVEGIYRRSHAWKMAEVWSHEIGGLLDAAVQDMLDPQGGAHQGGLAPPPAIMGGGEAMPRPRSLRAESPTPSGRGKRESVMMLGLEALPVPAGIDPMGLGAGAGGSRPGSRAGSGKTTFDDILGGAGIPVDKKNKKKK